MLLPSSISAHAASSSRMSLRRVLVSSLPASPFTAIVCPSMLLFLAAFYILHAGVMLATAGWLSNQPSSASRACPQLMHFGTTVLAGAGLMLLVYLAAILPNALRHAMHAVGTDRRSKRSCRRRCIAVLYIATHLAQQVCWCALLLYHLQLNWAVYRSIDAQMDRVRAASLVPTDETSLSGVTLPSSSPELVGGADVALCGAQSSVNIVRWSLLCIIVTTALLLSLILVWLQETYSGISTWLRDARKSRSTRAWTGGAASRSPSHDRTPTARAPSETSSWLDMQTDDVELDLSGDEAHSTL